jgi:hypothetical protein
MADVQVRPLGTESCPADAVIPQSSEWIVKAVYASFDGTSAAGSFKPLVRVKSDAGLIVAESAQDTTVAAGASADCSWFPRVAAVAAAGSSVWTWGEAGTPTAGVNVPAISGGSPGTAVLGMESTSIYLSDSSVFAVGSIDISGTTYYGIGINTPGHYLAKGQAISGGTSSSGTIKIVTISVPGYPASYGSEGHVFVAPAGGIVEDGYYVEALTTIDATSGPFPTRPFLWEISNGTSNVMKWYMQMIVVRLDTDTTAL